jgi:hypothetical protein
MTPETTELTTIPLSPAEVPQPILVPAESQFERATKVANLCREIANRASKKIQGRTYICVEGWQSIAMCHDTIPAVEWVEDREIKGVKGVMAKAVLRRITDDKVISSAFGFVGQDEGLWDNRDAYANAGMAQTRACSRVCRNAYAYIIVIMNSKLGTKFETTPAEEMTAAEQGHPQPPARNGNGHAPPAPVTLKGVVSDFDSRASNGRVFHGALVGEARVVTTELGHTLKQLGGLEVSVSAVLSKKPGVYHLRSIQSVTSPNGAAKGSATKPDEASAPNGNRPPAPKPAETSTERTPYEEVQRQLVESDINEHWALKAAQRLQFIPADVQRLGDLGEKQLRVLLVRFSDLIKAAREEEQGLVEQAAA